jgi:hypothetical protein
MSRVIAIVAVAAVAITALAVVKKLRASQEELESAVAAE